MFNFPFFDDLLSQYDTIEELKLTWTQKLSVVSA